MRDRELESLIGEGENLDSVGPALPATEKREAERDALAGCRAELEKRFEIAVLEQAMGRFGELAARRQAE
jgi:hypothetical protein